MLDTIIFNVEHGQSIFFYPREHPEYGMFVDCGNTSSLEPIDFLIKQNLLHHDGTRHVLGNLTLTNYDHDHFSGLPYIRQKAHIWTIQFAKNFSSEELKSLKPEITTALSHICYLKDTYTADAVAFKPPYVKAAFHLEQHHFPNGESTTNNLSQVVFVEFAGSVICICGDLEAEGWELLLQRQDFVGWLKKTNILVTAHHGRESGYAEEIFEHCRPECVIVSDKAMVHGTQEGMCQTYANHVAGNGVLLLDQRSLTGRKVLTTRSDGHILTCPLQ